MHEAAEQVGVLQREAEHAGDHVDRDVLGVLDSSVDHITACIAPSNSRQYSASGRNQLVDVLRRERGEQHSACVRVIRRVRRNRWRNTLRCEFHRRPVVRDHNAARREVFGVVRDR